MHQVPPLKKILSLRRSESKRNRKSFSMSPKSIHKFLVEYKESFKESLLVGELSDGSQHKQAHVPKGSLAVYVGREQHRFVIPMTYLSMPEFRVLMESVADEFGYEHEGGLQFPCEEEEFQEILHRCVSRQKIKCKSKSKSKNI